MSNKCVNCYSQLCGCVLVFLKSAQTVIADFSEYKIVGD